MKTFAILVGGGPAPGINGVIAAATIEARNHGLRVLGILDGYKWLTKGDTSHVRDLDIVDVSRLHFEGGSVIRTSRENPAKSAESLNNVIIALRQLEVSYLLTIGGDDTAFAASRLSAALGADVGVAHVPKTIDNDLPLPPEVVTFGFTTACNLGKDLVHNLMQDAATTERWFVVTVMGRRAGHLALGIGGSAGATLTVIREEFVDTPISLDQVADILEGAILKRRAQGRDHGVALLSEGIADGLDPATLGAVDRDSYGNIRLSELDLGRLVRERVTASLAARGLKTTIVCKDLGYELRCAPPGGYDVQYCRSLGYWATRFLLEGQTGAMVTIQGGRLKAMAFTDMLDPASGRVRVRMVDVTSEAYKTLYAYMIRLKPEDLTDPVQLRALAKTANLSEGAFRERFTPVARTP